MDQKKIKLPHGIPGHNLKKIEREVNIDEPTPWPVNEDLKVIGKKVRRTDAEAKVTGEAIYTADVHLPGMLIGKLLTCPHPSARINSIDVSAAKSHPGVYAVYVIEQVAGMAETRGGETNENRYPAIKYAGQPVAGVAALSEHVAEEALQLIKVDYRRSPFVVDIEEAMQTDAPRVYRSDVDQEETEGGGGSEKGLSNQGNIRGPSTPQFLRWTEG